VGVRDALLELVQVGGVDAQRPAVLTGRSRVGHAMLLLMDGFSFTVSTVIGEAGPK
jgi:hypothetical protein